MSQRKAQANELKGTAYTTENSNIDQLFQKLVSKTSSRILKKYGVTRDYNFQQFLDVKPTDSRISMFFSSFRKTVDNTLLNPANNTKTSERQPNSSLFAGTNHSNNNYHSVKNNKIR